ncbi:MAG: DUF1186 domain-containing protein [Alphaproteobacteria bacterium]|nr:DUF1186 domain-containing protein [Rhodospirillales bacterium]MCW9046190.1 DUF1186 domain-containing protein [Alphaproteobacteria bacterium]
MHVPPYIGNEAFADLLDEHDCLCSFEEIRFRIFATIISPWQEEDIYPLIEEFFDYDLPDFSSDEEKAGLILLFLGLRNEIDEQIQRETIKLSSVDTYDSIDEILYSRIDCVSSGFIRGVWGEEEKLPITLTMASMLTSLEESCFNYDRLLWEVLDKKNVSGKQTQERSETDLLAEIAKIDQNTEESMASLAKAFQDDGPAADRKKLTHFRHLLEVLTFSDQLPKEAIRECIFRKDELVPVFINILRDFTRNSPDIDDRQNALLIIVHMLGEIGAPQAFSPLMDMLEGDSDRIYELLDDAVTESMGKILISVFDGNTDRLYKIMDNPKADEFICSGIFDTWTYFVAAGQIDREEAKQYLSTFFERNKARKESYIWLAWTEAIAQLGFTELSGLVRQAYSLGKIPPRSLLPEEFNEIIEEASKTDDLILFLKKDGIYPFTDTIAALGKWHIFSEQYLQEKRAKELAQKDELDTIPFMPTIGPAVNQNKSVGRNDPCPCGSGKKFKKCCLH